MYLPQQYREERSEILASAIRSIQFAALVTPTAGELQISHVPVVLKTESEHWALECHISRKNPHWIFARSPISTVAIFQGPHSYISPSWYASKQEHGKVVPTWNYIAIHVHGQLESIDDFDWLLNHITDLTNANEQDREHPWKVMDAPDDYVRGMAGAIVGLRLTVSSIEGAWKMAQRRSEADRLGVIHGLELEAPPPNVADIMRELEEHRNK